MKDIVETIESLNTEPDISTKILCIQGKIDNEWKNKKEQLKKW